MKAIAAIVWSLALHLPEVVANTEHDPRDLTLPNETRSELRNMLDLPATKDTGLQITRAGEVEDLERSFQNMKTICYNIAGVAIVIFGVVLAFVNERRHVRMQAVITWARSKVVEVASPAAAKFGDLVHVSGTLSASSDLLVDSGLTGLSHVQAPVGSVKMKRTVEMYQWRQRSGDRYVAEWLDYHMDSKKFADQRRSNPQMPCSTTVYYHPGVSLNDFDVPASLLGKLQGWYSLRVTEEVLARLRLNDSFERVCPDGAGLDPWIYFRLKGNSGTQPGIGDVRIRYWYVPESTVSITAIFNGDEFSPMCFKDVVPMHKKRASTSLSSLSLEEGEQETLVNHGPHVKDFEETPDLFEDFRRGVRTLSRLDPARFLLEWYIICTCCGACLAFFEASVPTEVFIISEGSHGARENLKSLEGRKSLMGAMLQSLRILSFLIVWAGLHQLVSFLVSIFNALPLLGSSFVLSLRVTTSIHALSVVIMTLAAAWYSYKSTVCMVLSVNAMGLCALAISVGHLAS